MIVPNSLLEKGYIKISEKKQDAEKERDRVVLKEQELKEFKKEIEKRESKETDPKEKKIIEKERWQIEDKIKETEKEKWDKQEKFETAEREEKETKQQYQEAVNKENLLRQELDEIKTALGDKTVESLNDVAIIKKYIDKYSYNKEEDLKKVKDDSHFFNYILGKAREEFYK